MSTYLQVRAESQIHTCRQAKSQVDLVQNINHHEIIDRTTLD